MKIAVLGGGNGSYAAAADLSDQGHEVRLWRRDAGALQELSGDATITLRDYRGVRDVALSLATGDIGAAIERAELIVVPTPAFAQEDIAQALAPHLSDGQVIYLPPGTFGSYAMIQLLRAAKCGAQVAIARLVHCLTSPASVDRGRSQLPRTRDGCLPASFQQKMACAPAP